MIEWKCSTCQQWVSGQYPAHTHAWHLSISEQVIDPYLKTSGQHTTYRKPDDEIRETKGEDLKGNS